MWPTPQDYNESIQNPGLCFSDPELRACVPETNALGLPRVISGSFASVYRLIGPGKQFAVRCFLRNVPDQAERYLQISQCLSSLHLPYAVPFEFIPQGIKIGAAWYPILKMEWVSGLPLIELLERRLTDRAAIEGIHHAFYSACRSLHASGIAHGDLQHGNILVVGNQLKLVDYDGMFVPALGQFGSRELGHRHYQHPQRNDLHFGTYLDNFAAWSISTSLYCLSKDPRLWTRLGAGDECLLFRQEDYLNPVDSIAFRFLEHHDLEGVRDASRVLRCLLKLRTEDVPPLGEPVEKPLYVPELEAPQVRVEPNLRVAHRTALALKEAPPRLRVVDDGGDQMPFPPLSSPGASKSPSAPPAHARAMAVHQVNKRRTQGRSTPAPPAPPPKKQFRLVPKGYEAPLIALMLPFLFMGLISVTNVSKPLWNVKPAPPPAHVYTLRPLSPAVYREDPSYTEGRQLFRQGKYKEALASFTEAFKRAKPEATPFCQYQIGRCYSKLNQPDQALYYMTQAEVSFRETHTFIPNLKFDIANTNLKIKNYARAAQGFSQFYDLCLSFGMPYPWIDTALKGLRIASLRQIADNDIKGIHYYDKYAELVEMNPDTRTQIYGDLSKVALQLEQKKEWNHAYQVWLELTRTVFTNPGTSEQVSNLARSKTLNEAMINNRLKAGMVAEATRLEQQNTRGIPNPPPSSNLDEMHRMRDLYRM